MAAAVLTAALFTTLSSGWAQSTASIELWDEAGEVQRELYRRGVITRLKPRWSVDEGLDWLRVLQTPEIMSELTMLAAADEAAEQTPTGTRMQPELLFQPNWDPTHILSDGDVRGWSSLPLMNRGQLLPSGCLHASLTCAALEQLRQFLSPKPPAATEVGVRILKLKPGAALRQHYGPGGRLVAHLGIQVPPGATMTLANETVVWKEGDIILFDDSFSHSAKNAGTRARYILHITFPHPDIVGKPEVVMPVTQAHKVIASTNTSYVRLDFYDSCAVQATNLRNQSLKSAVEPLLTLFNKVSDNQDSDWDSCTSATAVADDTLRITAPHGYGSLDIGFTAFDTWVTFTLRNLDAWTGDPKQRHLRFSLMCPTDICEVPGTYSVPGVGGAVVDGLFQGFRGAEGLYPDSTGFLTISSDWQHANEMWFAQNGWSVAYTLAPTAILPKVWAGVRANHPEIPKPNKNRARTWYWAGGSAATLNDTIALVKSMGIELIFFGSFMNNIGDYTSDPVRWPNGLGAIRDRIHAAGLQIGLHIISPGTTVCLDQMSGCKGNIHIDTVVSRQHPELFVPQGPAPRDWYWANSAGTWYCHEKTGRYCHDLSKNAYLVAGPGHPHAAPPDNPIELVGNVTWSKLGRYREGGAILFDGSNHSYGTLNHTNEYNFTYNEYYPTAISEFTLQMVIHPVGPTVERVQVLAHKCNDWQLRINMQGKIEWHVHLVGDGPGDIATNPWTFATGTRVLQPGRSYVVKATHAGGTLKVFTCELGEPGDFRCNLGPTPEGVARGQCTETKQFWTTDDSTVGEASKVNCLYNNGNPSCFIWGAEQNAAGDGADKGFHGAMEEMFLAKLSLENITAHLYSCPACGCNNFYIWDYTNPAAREFWANGTSRLFNEAGAEASQWDGTDMIGGWGWGIPHSKKTWSAGYGPYWQMSAEQAYVQSKSLWKQDLAVENSGGLNGGLGAWHGDMMPFADEQLIKGGICVGGDQWHRGLLLRIVQTGLLYNAYNTPVETLHNLTEVDCFIGGLVATGIPPQMTAGTTPAAKPLIPRIKYWLDLYRVYGMATESSIDVLHYPDIFLVGLSGGTEPGDHRGLFAGNTTLVQFPDDLADNATVLTFLGYQIPFTNISFGSQDMTAVTLFAASDNATVHMSGGFWNLTGQSVIETILPANGSTASQREVFPQGTTGLQVHSVWLHIGDYARYYKQNSRLRQI